MKYFVCYIKDLKFYMIDVGLSLTFYFYFLKQKSDRLNLLLSEVTPESYGKCFEEGHD